MRWFDKYLIYSSVFALFTEDFSFYYIIDWKLFYVILLFNFVLFATKKKIIISKNIILIISFLLIHGVIFIIWFQNPIKSLFAQLLGIIFCSIYYYNFFKEYGSKLVFEKYLELAFIVAILAIPMFFLKINIQTSNRLNGILTEPAHYTAIMLPAAYCFLRKKNYFKLAVLVLTIFLAKSTIGYFGLVLILILPLLKVKYFVKYSWIAIIILGTSVYYINNQWNKPINENEGNVLVRRLKETNKSFNAIFTGKFERYTNLSSYAFLSNSFVARKIFLDKPLGTGLGSYPYEYEKYYSLMSPPPYLLELKQSKINKTDANSLFLRMLADLGVIAIFIFLYFTLRSVNVFRNDRKVFQQSSFFYLIVKLIREGHYFPPEFYFFLLIFLKDFNEDITHS